LIVRGSRAEDKAINTEEADMRSAVTAAVVTAAVVTLATAGAVQAKAQQSPGVCYVTTEPKYPDDGARASDIAKWMAAGAAAAGLPRELPVIASLVESGLKNGAADRDSAGFFQMRLGSWNKGEYIGYASRPDLQLKWFIDQAILFKGLRFRSNQTNLLKDSSRWGDWIADIERPTDHSAGSFQRQLRKARALLSSR
jgi:hypothetical protein